jgi:hypothetical protein
MAVRQVNPARPNGTIPGTFVAVPSLTDLPRIPHGFKAELAAMVRLALPIVVVQLGQMLMGARSRSVISTSSARPSSGWAC